LKFADHAEDRLATLAGPTTFSKLLSRPPCGVKPNDGQSERTVNGFCKEIPLLRPDAVTQCTPGSATAGIWSTCLTRRPLAFATPMNSAVVSK